MVVPFCAKPVDAAHAMAHAAIAAAKRNLFDGKLGNLFPSMRKLLDMPSVAQSLDGQPSHGESASPKAIIDFYGSTARAECAELKPKIVGTASQLAQEAIGFDDELPK